MPPKNENVCDNCQGDLIIRKDDNITTIKNRLKVFLESSMPLIEYYRNKNLLLEVNSDLDKDKVFEQITALLKK